MLRYYRPDLLYEVTARAVDGRFFFDPSRCPDLAAEFHGIVARAQKKYEVRVFAYFLMSNHYHALYAAPDPDSMADFLCYVHGELGRLANRLNDRKGRVYSDRCDVRPVLDHGAQVKRLGYIMAQAYKAGLAPIDAWAGANTNRALMYGEPLVGKHVDRSQRTLDERRVGGAGPEDSYVSEHEVKLSPLPEWQGLSEAELRQRYCEVAAAAQAEYRPVAPPAANGLSKASFFQNHETTGVSSEVESRPPPNKGSPDRRRPLAYAASPPLAKNFAAEYRRVRESHREAAEKLAEQVAAALRGEPSHAVTFPIFTFASPARTGRYARQLGLDREALAGL